MHAETPEVIKSALMAGANRSIWADYGQAGNGTANGLDVRYGAGQLDILESFHIIASREYDSLESGGNGNIPRYGFDYVTDFMPGQTATYEFSVGSFAESLSVSLAWSVDIEISGSEISASLPSFALSLRRKVSDGLFEAVRNVAGPGENTAHMWISDLAPGSDYVLQISRLDLLAGGDIPDLGLSWRRNLDGVVPGDVNGNGSVGLEDFLVLKNNFGNTGDYALGDLNGDGVVGLFDFNMLKGLFGSVESEAGISGGELKSVPEVPSQILAWAGLANIAVWRLIQRRRRAPKGRQAV
jgi:hypothetical protein